MELLNITDELEGMPANRMRFIEASRLRMMNAAIVLQDMEAAKREARRIYGDARMRHKVRRDARKLLECAAAHGCSVSKPYWFDNDGFGNRMLMVPDDNSLGTCVACVKMREVAS